MGQHLEELKVYCKELQQRYNRQVDFLKSPKFNTLHYEQKYLLGAEVKVMKEHLKIIKKRIRLDEQIERETNYIP